MRKGNGSNGIPAWVKADLRMLKRVSVSLVETVRETRREMSEMHRQNQRRFAENERILARLDEQTADIRLELVEMKAQTADIKKQTASLKHVSDIHTKAILKLLEKI